MAAVDTDGLTPTHSYPRFEQLGVLEPPAEEMYPWATNRRNGQIVLFSRLADLPDEAAVDVKNARAAGIKSNLTIPMAIGTHTFVGALAFNTLREERDWPDELVKRLHRIADVFTNVLARNQREEELRSSRSAARKAPSPVRSRVRRVGLRSRTVRRFFSTRSGNCRLTSRQSCCA